MVRRVSHDLAVPTTSGLGSGVTTRFDKPRLSIPFAILGMGLAFALWKTGPAAPTITPAAK